MQIYHLVIFLIALFLTPLSFANAETLTVDGVICPTELVAGERGNVSFNLKNSFQNDLLIADANLLMDYIGTGIQNRTEIPITSISDFPILPSSSKTIEEIVSFTSEGIHHVDLEIKYSGSSGDGEKIILKEICRVKTLPFENDPDPIGLTVIISIITSSFGGVTAYLIKRYFVKKDVEYQKSIDHQHWLLQQIHSHASKYYFPLAKESWIAEKTISVALQSKKQEDIDIAFDSLNVFLKKYLDFQNETGANFLFRDRDWENHAIRIMQSILVSLPYDEKNRDAISQHLALKQPIPGLPPISPEHEGAFEKLRIYFKNWIKSEHCERSLKMVMSKLGKFGLILDQQGELISHPDLIGRHYDLPRRKEKQNNFWILYSSTKYVKKNETIFVFGHGLNDIKNIQYQFYIGSHKLQETGERKDNVVELQLPSELEPGAYDIYAEFFIPSQSIKSETIGIVVHVDV